MAPVIFDLNGISTIHMANMYGTISVYIIYVKKVHMSVDYH